MVSLPTDKTHTIEVDSFTVEDIDHTYFPEGKRVELWADLDYIIDEGYETRYGTVKKGAIVELRLQCGQVNHEGEYRHELVVHDSFHPAIWGNLNVWGKPNA